MKRIGLINYDMTIYGGAQRVLANLANAFCDQYEIFVISLTAEKGTCCYHLQESIQYETILAKKARIRQTILKGGRKLCKYIDRHNIQIVFYVGAYAGLCGGIMARRCRVKKVFCDHGALMNQWDEYPARIMRKVGSGLSDITIVLTEQSRRAYIDKWKRNPDNVVVIYNWIEEEVFEKSRSYDNNSNRILTVGRFSHEKGYDLMVETAVKIHEKYDDWVWEIYGDGDMLPEIQNKISEAGLESHVICKGAADSVYECYKGHALYVLTSYREGLPMVLLEAKGNHIPAVSFDIVTGPREILEDGKDGVLIPPYDTDKMAEEIIALLHDRKRRKQMSEATGWNLKRFSKEEIMEKWKELMG
ncbi:MAG: glycosyltransferase family 4 protein [Lachnoclostridium sp.]|jgi:glycosyltransferase involved in cell wall biosynthesis|nr:glycosyltransferase family 4 protein [Lachnoclostridium sp.]